MSQSTIRVQVTNVCSNQEYGPDPDMIEIEMDAKFLSNAECCVAFMKERGLDYVCAWWALSFTLYSLNEDGKSPLNGLDGLEYTEFNPDEYYALDGCHAKIFKDGEIQAVLPIRKDDAELWCTVGSVADLKLKLAPGADKPAPAKPRLNENIQVVVFSSGGIVDSVAVRELPPHDPQCIVVDYDDRHDDAGSRGGSGSLSEEDYERKHLGVTREVFDQKATQLLG